MRIITISREFGSGGRELGKRLAEELGIICYDQQIIEMIAEKKKLDQNYVSSISETDIRKFYPSTIGKRFVMHSRVPQQSVAILSEQKKIIEELASQGDCVIVGRGADIILAACHPLRIFVYADQADKLARCRLRSEEDEQLTDAQLTRKMKEIDKERAANRALFTSDKWGSRNSYDLCINTSGQEIKSLIPALAAYAEKWFEAQKAEETYE